MRLLRFHARARYRNLPSQPVKFSWVDQETSDDEVPTIRFLVGANGVGKSNMLRFITAIFAALEDNYSAPTPDNPAYFTPFRLSYQVHRQTVTVESEGRGRAGVTITQSDVNNGKPLRVRDLVSSTEKLHIPRRLLAYTSGDLDLWRRIFEAPPAKEMMDSADRPDVTVRAPLDLQLDEEMPPGWKALEQGKAGITILGGGFTFEASSEVSKTPDSSAESEKRERGQVFLVEPGHLPLALLSALIHYQTLDESEVDPEASFRAVLDQLELERLIAFSLELRLDNVTPRINQKLLLRRLHEEATMQVPPLRSSETDEQLWVFDVDEVREGSTLLRRLVRNPDPDKYLPILEDSFLFFRELVGLLEDGILRRINLVLNKKGENGNPARSLLATSLSDGELAFLQRMALVHILSTSECLFIFDEPDTHFNDNWRRDLVNHLEQTLKGNKLNSEVILTTHASITLSDAYPEEVILLGKEGQEAVPLTLATAPDEILRSVFGAERSVGKRAQRRVEKVLESGNKQALEDLLYEVGPGYYRYRIIEELDKDVS
jgi:energy-coupling factor transporter ATP-binding protein EcfA2